MGSSVESMLGRRRRVAKHAEAHRLHAHTAKTTCLLHDFHSFDKRGIFGPEAGARLRGPIEGPRGGTNSASALALHQFHESPLSKAHTRLPLPTTTTTTAIQE